MPPILRVELRFHPRGGIQDTVVTGVEPGEGTPNGPDFRPYKHMAPVSRSEAFKSVPLTRRVNRRWILPPCIADNFGLSR
jgi:hypothetical protein